MAAPATDILFLVGDIGGTNSRLRLLKINTDDSHKGASPLSAALSHEHKVAEKTYPSEQFPSLLAVIKRFLKEENKTGVAPTVCALAVAGPVTDNKASVTNLGWAPDGDAIAAEIGAQACRIMNDFSAVAYGLLALQPTDYHTLHDADCVPCGPIAVIGAGTGLGEAYLTHGSGAAAQYDVWPSEGGHADFAPRNFLEMKLVEYMSKLIAENKWAPPKDPDVVVSKPVAANDALSPSPAELYQTCEELIRKRKESDEKEALGAPLLLGATSIKGRIVRVSVERIVSGTGFPHIYGFLKEEFKHLVDPKVDAEIAAAKWKDKSKIISKHAIDKTDELCQKAMEIFVSAYGSEAGNLALKTLPTGGLYVAGGIAEKILPALRENKLFWRHMVTKGRLTKNLTKVPVFVVKADVEVGLLGAQVLARRVLRSVLQDTAATPASASSGSSHSRVLRRLYLPTMPGNRPDDKQFKGRFRYRLPPKQDSPGPKV